MNNDENIEATKTFQRFKDRIPELKKKKEEAMKIYEKWFQEWKKTVETYPATPMLPCPPEVDVAHSAINDINGILDLVENRNMPPVREDWGGKKTIYISPSRTEVLREGVY